MNRMVIGLHVHHVILIYLLIGAHEVIRKVLHVNNFVFGHRIVAEIRVAPFHNFNIFLT